MPDAAYVEKWGIGPHEAADACVIRGDEVLLIRRRDTGAWALPGGFLEPEETHLRAAIRELLEETGVEVGPANWLDAIRRDAYERDPRAWIRTWVHLFRVEEATPVAADDATDCHWWSVQALPRMYADHRSIVEELTAGLSQRGVPR